MEFNTYTLQNGIRCIHRQVRSQVCHCAMTINTGSRDELKNQFGIAHLIEHSIFKGTKKRKAFQINSRLESLGGELNAYTSKEETVIHTTTLKKDTPRAVELLSDIIFNSTFPQKLVEQEVQVIIDEINSYKDSPSEQIFDDYEDLMFKDSPLGHNILGTKQKLMKYGRSEIETFMQRTYNTDQMVFSIIGNISEARFITICDTYFGDVKASYRSFEREKTGIYTPFNISKNKNGYQTNCIIGNRAYDINEPKRVTLGLLTNMLGGPLANSILNIAVREKKGLTYSIESNYTPYSDTGFFTTYFSCEHSNAERCLEIINAELNNIKNGRLSARKISMAKKQYLAQIIIGMESRESYMFSAARSYMIFNRVDSMEAINEKIMSITAEEVADVANEIFNDQMSTLLFK
ncbi:MAG: pitrilysin family protein [Rikenellaceae bacterium]